MEIQNEHIENIEATLKIELKDFAPLLKKHGVKFEVNGVWLVSGKTNYDKRWILFISLLTKYTFQTLEKLLPFLRQENISFRLVKNEYFNYRVNGGEMGPDEIGKIITVFPENIEQAKHIIEVIEHLTKGCKGVIVDNSVKLGDVLYASYSWYTAVEKDGKWNRELKFSVPSDKIPFAVNKKNINLLKKKRLIGWFYVPLDAKARSCRGTLYLGMNFKWLACKECIIKEGVPFGATDPHDRDIKDRLLWQKSVLQDLKGKLPVPKVISFIERNGFSYLIMEYIEGGSLQDKVVKILNHRKWRDLPQESKKEILVLYRDAVKLIEAMHNLGYIHRDITATNFLINKKGQMFVIDFEMTYNYKMEEPNPPFITGTHGYVAPEQVLYERPHIKEDVYSLGALLCFCVTGVPPIAIIESKLNRTTEKFERITGDWRLVELITQCLQNAPKHRPEISTILDTINEYFYEHQSKNLAS